MGIYFESKEQVARNKQTGQRPPGVSDEEWFGAGQYFDHCHWYDKKGTGHCCGEWHHDHTPVVMKIYWKSPLAWVIPPLAFAWELRWFVLSRLLEKLGWYWLLERLGVDTSPR